MVSKNVCALEFACILGRNIKCSVIIIKIIVCFVLPEPGVPTSVDFVRCEVNQMVVAYSSSNAYVFDTEKGKPITVLDSKAVSGRYNQETEGFDPSLGWKVYCDNHKNRGGKSRHFTALTFCFCIFFYESLTVQ